MAGKHCIRNLDFFLLDTKNPAPEFESRVEAAFKLWRAVWENSFDSIEVDYGTKLNSDPFLEREASALFCGDHPVALFFNSWYRVKDSQLSHSYFNNYPVRVIEAIKEFGVRELMVLSFMTIHPEWRKEFTDLPLTDVLFSLGVKRFESSTAPILIGYIRKDIGSFHHVFARHGGKLMAQSTAYNVDVDFMYITRESMQLSSIPGVADTVEHLWSKQYRSENKKKNVDQTPGKEAIL